MSTTTLHPTTAATTTPRRSDHRSGYRPDYRLTRRGRLVVVAFALLVALAITIAVAGVSVATQEKGEPVPTETILVTPGDTLWDIAAAAADDGDVREMMQRIEHLNALESPVLASGQRLSVPLD